MSPGNRRSATVSIIWFLQRKACIGVYAVGLSSVLTDKCRPHALPSDSTSDSSDRRHRVSPNSMQRREHEDKYLNMSGSKNCISSRRYDLLLEKMYFATPAAAITPTPTSKRNNNNNTSSQTPDPFPFLPVSPTPNSQTKLRYPMQTPTLPPAQM